MEENYSLGLALFNFLPNLIFLAGAAFLARWMATLGMRAGSWVVIAGGLLTGVGGMLKAAWKLLFVLKIADIQWMSEIQFILIAPGYLLILIAVSEVVRPKRIPAAAAPAFFMAGWKIPFLAVMTLASIGAQGILAWVALRKQALLAAGAFLVALLCLLAMGGFAGGEQTLQRQWLEEIINTTGQAGFAMGAWILWRKEMAGMGGAQSA